jgi:hypothetical protein
MGAILISFVWRLYQTLLIGLMKTKVVFISEERRVFLKKSEKNYSAFVLSFCSSKNMIEAAK